MKLSIKNITKAPYGARTTTGVVMVEPGAVYEGEFEDAEAENIKANKSVFQTGSKLKADAAESTDADLEQQVADLTAENKALKAELAKFDHDGNGGAGGSPAKPAEPVKAETKAADKK
jgi:hypothetical protein